MFKSFRGKTKVVYLPVTTSTALTAGDLLTFTSGKLVAATSATAASAIIGVNVKTIASTDTDYATDRLIPVEIPVERFTAWEADVTSGLVVGDIGKEVDLTDAATVNRAATSVGVVMPIAVKSTTKGIFRIKFTGSY